MDWYVVRHPDTGGLAVVPASALDLHRGTGWVRVSYPVAEMDRYHVDLSGYADAPDLDTPPAPDSSAETTIEQEE